MPNSMTCSHLHIITENLSDIFLFVKVMLDPYKGHHSTFWLARCSGL